MVTFQPVLYYFFKIPIIENTNMKQFIPYALIVMLFFTACAPVEDDQPTLSSASLSFATYEETTTAKALADTAAHVVVSEAKILVKRIHFHSSIEGDSLNFKTEALVVDLDMTGELTTVGVEEMPHGTYDRVSFNIHKPADSLDTPDKDFYEGESGKKRYSVIVSGVLHDTIAFTYKSSRSAKQKIHIDPELVVTDSTPDVNVSLTVDVNSWFIGLNGAELDPTDPDDENKIDAAIKRSFRAFEDNGHRGNHRRHGPGNGSGG